VATPVKTGQFVRMALKVTAYLPWKANLNSRKPPPFQLLALRPISSLNGDRTPEFVAEWIRRFIGGVG
jgi:hypothetical protein